MTSARPHPTAQARVVAVLAAALTAVGLTGCTPDRPAPDAAAEALATGLERLDLSDVPLEGTTSAEAGTQLAEAVEGLAPWRPAVEVAAVRVDEDDDTAATATLEVVWDVDAGGTDWEYAVTAPLQYVEPDEGEGEWRVRWSPDLVAPGLVAGERMTVERVLPERAEVLGAGGTTIVQSRPVQRLGIDKTRVDLAGQDAAARALAAVVGIDPEQYASRVAAAGEKAFVEAIVVRTEDPGDIDVAAAQAIGGVAVVADTLPLAPTRRFARPLLGTVGEATAEVVEASGGAVVAGDLVGLSGLQQQYDRRLRGLPGLTITTTGSAGGGTRDLFRTDPRPGQPLTTTLDVRLQDLAEDTLAGVVPASAVVALRPSTGEVLAAASGPGGGGLSTATVGRYPPGSTFKIATSLALVRAGLTPESTVACPPTITADGRTFQNYPGYPADRLGDVPLRTAIAFSCNTAMIGARDTVPQAALAEAARSLGVGQPDDVGFPAFLGSVPTQAEGTEHAASMIGQGRVEASPLAMAVVAASVAAGRTVRPVLVLDADDEADARTDDGEAGDGGDGGDGGEGRDGGEGGEGGDDGEQPAASEVPLTPAESEALRTLMRAVVTEGSGTFLADVPGEPIGAKSGTAQFGTEDPPRNHAWMIATQGDLAVAVFVEEGDFGTTTAGPLLEAFLRGAAG